MIWTNRRCIFGVLLGFWVTFFVPAAAPAADLRIIFIDDDLYSQISDASQRQLALNELLGDIETIITAGSDSTKTIILYNLGDEIELLGKAQPARNIVETLRNVWLYREIRDGKSHGGSNSYGVDVGRLRDKLHDILNNERLDRVSAGETRQVDLHMFASRWYRSKATSTGNMLGQEYSGYCYNLEDQGTRHWPEHVNLIVEFRTADGFTIPTESALHGFSTIISGSSATDGPVRMRGESPVGPKCPMAGTFYDFPTPISPGNAGITCNGPKMIDEAALPTQLRCKTNDHPPVGAIDERPVHLVAREDEVAFGQYAFSQRGTAMQMRVSTGVGGPVIVPGQGGFGPTGTARNVQAELALTPNSGCVPRDLIGAYLNADRGGIDLIASRAACRAISLSIGEVTLQ